MKTHLHFEDLTQAQAATILAAAHGAGASVGAPAPLAPSVAGLTPAAPPPLAPPAAAPPPVAPPAAAAPPPPAPVAVAATPGSDPALLNKMQEHVKTHKSASLKHILGKLGITKVTEANAAQAQWLHQVFDTGRPGPEVAP